MKLIHCADMHLDSKLGANLSKEKAKERRHELINTFIRMVEYAKTNGIEAILICGDMFDTHNISALTRNTVSNLLKDNPGIDFYYLRGNHDDLSIETLFDEVPSNLHLFSDTWTSYNLGKTGKTFLYGVELTAENSISALQNFVPDPAKINIVMLHGQEQMGASGDKAEVINLKLLKNKGINYIALGHVHEYKAEKLDGECRYCYPGCLEGRGFDETGEHGFVELFIDEEKGIVTDTFIPFATRKLYDVSVDISGLTNSMDIIEKVRNVLSDSPATSGDMVKIVLSGYVGIECEKDIEFIRRTFENDFYFFKVYDHSHIKIDYESFLYDSSLKGEFVRTVLGDDTLSDDEKGEIVKLGLSVLMGGEI